MNLLHIDSSILGPNSVSRRLSAAIVAKLRNATPDMVNTYRDLSAEAIPHLSGTYLMAAQNPSGTHSSDTKADLALGNAILQEFLAAEVVVIGVALYNFGIASTLKAWIDRIMVAGQTFKYGPDGHPVGLAGKKRLLLAIARGGYYGPGSPAASFEHAETYLRAAFAFVGITSPEVIIAEGLAVGQEQRDAAIAGAEQHISTIAA